MELRPECWICNDLCNGLERNWNGLERTIYVPILTMLPVILIKRGVMVLKENQDPLPLLCECCIRAKMAVLCREQPNWLPAVGHTLAKTHVYKSKYTSLRTYWLTVICPVCVHGPLPDPWLSWALAWTSCMHKDPIWLLIPSWAMMQLSKWVDPWLLLFSFSLTSLISFAAGGASSVLPPCLIYK